MPPYYFSRAIRYSSLLLVLLLSSCAVQPPKEGKTRPISQLYEENTWRAKGKFAVRYNNKSQSVNFSWKQNLDEFVIHLYGPLGQGSVYIRGDDRKVVLESKDGKTEAPTAEELLYSVNGWSLPVSSLVYWLRGLPSKSTEFQSADLNEKGVFTSLFQDGWHIEYLSHLPVEGYLLPKKMKAQRDELKLTLNIKFWKL